MSVIKKRGGAVGVVCSVGAIIAIIIGNGQVRTNQEGLELIGNAESCRRDPYICPAGVLTNGIGNTHNVKPGVLVSDKEIASTWQKNILEAEACVNRYANGKRLNDNQFSAATSVTFRAGCGNMRTSTMFKNFRNNQFVEACEQFSRWVWGGGKVLPGLVTRAGNEKRLCLKGVK